MLRGTCLIMILALVVGCGHSQEGTAPRLVGGPCDGCEAILEYGDRKLSATDSLPDLDEEGMRIKVEGTIYQADGRTPAEGAILYVYHTDQEGLYTPVEGAKGWGKHHGRIRGWLRTGADGRYEFHTLKPAPYPSRTNPAHINYTVMEPNGKYYWLGSCHFAGDSLLSAEQLAPAAPRGGPGEVLHLTNAGDHWVGTRDIILGRNIPQYE